MMVRGIPYQYTRPKDIFLGKYMALDGTERERWINTRPDADAFYWHREFVERVLRRHEVSISISA